VFRRLPEAAGPPVSFTIDGQPAVGTEGDTVAAALLAYRIREFRTTPVTGARRGPFCLMGVCFDCLVAIDGLASRQACLVPLREGMRVETRQGKREPGR